MTSTKNLNERTIDRIDTFLALEVRKDRYGVDDEAVLAYVRDHLTPEKLERRADSEFDSGSVAHLLEVAKMRLAPYAKEIDSTDD